MFRSIAHELSHWLSSGEQIALATVVWAEGSSPRPVGARMAVTASGKMTGSVSGGCVEGSVFEAAQEVLSEDAPQLLRYSAVDEQGWEVGLACGGTIEVYVEPLREAHRRLLKALLEEETVALATRLDGGGHLLAWPDGRLDGDRSLAPELSALFPGPAHELRRDLDEPALSLSKGGLFLEVFTRPPTLTIVGAVHIAVPLVTMAQTLGFHVRVVDARRAFATEERFSHADELIIGWPREGLEPGYLRPSDAVVILTHDPKFDLPALEIALRSEVGYVGLLGSTSTQEKRQQALRDRDFGAEELARIHGPVGLNLGGRSPAKIALAIMAEIVSCGL